MLRNGDEYLNKGLKRDVNAAALPHKKDQLNSRISDFIEKLMQLSERVRNYFKHPCIQYSAGH